MPIEYKGIESHKKILSSGSGKASQVSKKVIPNLAKDGKKREELKGALRKLKKAPRSEQKRFVDRLLGSWKELSLLGIGGLELYRFLGPDKSDGGSKGKSSGTEVVIRSGNGEKIYYNSVADYFKDVDRSNKTKNEKLREKVEFLFNQWWEWDTHKNYFDGAKMTYDNKWRLWRGVAPGKGNQVSPFFWNCKVSDYTTPWAPYSFTGEIYAYKTPGAYVHDDDIDGALSYEFDPSELKNKVLTPDSKFSEFDASDLVDVGPALREAVIEAGDNYRKVCLSNKSDKVKENAKCIVLANVVRWASAVCGVSDGFYPCCGWLARKYVGEMGIKNVDYLGVKWDEKGKRYFVDWNDIKDFDVVGIKGGINLWWKDVDIPYIGRVLRTMEFGDNLLWNIVKDVLRGNYKGLINDFNNLVDRELKISEKK